MSLKETPTDALLAELAARGGALHPDDVTPKARAILVAACTRTQFPPPPADTTLAEWSDTVLDSPLAPRGGGAWIEAHGYVQDALAAALAQSVPLTVEALTKAHAVVVAQGNTYCVCPTPQPPLVADAATGRMLCLKCRRRRRQG